MIVIWPFLILKGFNGLTLFPFIILKEENLKDNSYLINHEKIHLRQQLEMLIVFFYIWYLAEYFYYLLKFKDSKKAYYSIRFEKEAYTHQDDLHYLYHRKFWAFLNY